MSYREPTRDGTDFVLKRCGSRSSPCSSRSRSNFFLFRVMPGNAVRPALPELHSAVQGGHRPRVRAERVENGTSTGSTWTTWPTATWAPLYDNQPVWNDISGAAAEHPADDHRGHGDLHRARRRQRRDLGLASGHRDQRRLAVDQPGVLRHAHPVDRPAGGASRGHRGRPAPGRDLHRDARDPRAPVALGGAGRPRPAPDPARADAGLGCYGQYALVVRSAMLETLGGGLRPDRRAPRACRTGPSCTGTPCATRCCR